MDLCPPGLALGRAGDQTLGVAKGDHYRLRAAELKETSQVLEIGPGLGALTDPILATGVPLQVMEVDRDILARVRQRAEPNLQINDIHGNKSGLPT